METIKERLPEMLEEIQHYKEMARIHLDMYRFMITQCIREAIEPNFDGGYWTSEEAIEETYANYEDAVRKVKHLEWVVKNIKNFAKSS